MPIEDGAVHRASLVVADEFQAATFNSLHGFYRVAADCLSEKNLTLYRVSQIRSGKLFDHYDELDHIFQVGEKIASFYLRDLVFIYGLDSLIIIAKTSSSSCSPLTYGFVRLPIGLESFLLRTVRRTGCARRSSRRALKPVYPH